MYFVLPLLDVCACGGGGWGEREVVMNNNIFIDESQYTRNILRKKKNCQDIEQLSMKVSKEREEKVDNKEGGNFNSLESVNLLKLLEHHLRD